jgi:hypothetical protein
MPRSLQQFKSDWEGIASSVYLARVAADQFWNRLATFACIPSYLCDPPARETSFALVT